MFRLFFLLITVVLVWLIVNSVMRAIIRALGGYRPQRRGQEGSPPRTVNERKEKFTDIKDADFTDIKDDKAPKS